MVINPATKDIILLFIGAPLTKKSNFNRRFFSAKERLSEEDLKELKKLNRYANFCYLGSISCLIFAGLSLIKVSESFKMLDRESKKNPQFQNYVINLPDYHLTTDDLEGSEFKDKSTHISIEMMPGAESSKEDMIVRVRPIVIKFLQQMTDPGVYYGCWANLLLTAIAHCSKNMYYFQMFPRSKAIIRLVLTTGISICFIAPSLVYLYYVYQPLKMISDNEIETILQNVKI